MKSKTTILSLAISALLSAGVASYSMSCYAGEDGSSKTTDSSSKKADSSSQKSDSDKRSDSISGDKSKQKITICHVPPGNPDQKHTIHIAFSAWRAHKDHTNKIGPDFADYLGSCNSKSTTTSKETLHVISDCTDTAHTALVTKVQSYYEPITVADTALDDESVVTAMSQCLDKGDSSDSGKNKADSSKSKSGGKGRGHDSVSDSGHHHRIRGCQNVDSTHKADSSKHEVSDSDHNDANKNYHKKLKDFSAKYDADRGLKHPIVVSDSSLDDKDVRKEYETCAKDSSDLSKNKIDSAKIGKKKGDSGHRQHVLKSCGATQDQKLRDAIDAYKEKSKSSTKDIILTEDIFNDKSVKEIITNCKVTEIPSSGTSGRINFREVTSPIKN